MDAFGLVVLAIGLLFLAAGVGLLVLSGRLRRSREAFATDAARGRGTITEIRWETVRRNDLETTRRARVHLDFRTADARPVQAWSFETSSPAAGKVGQELDVLYDPADPRRVRVAEDRRALRMAGGFFTVFASVFATVGALIAVAGAAILLA